MLAQVSPEDGVEILGNGEDGAEAMIVSSIPDNGGERFATGC
jgi:hypothetical protein